MEIYKEEFTQFLLKTGALRVGEDRTLRSKRISPWFVNIGDFNDGVSTEVLGNFYADSLLHSGSEFNLLYGIPEKGNALAVVTSICLHRKGKNVPWFSTRKIPKDYGEATNLLPQERIKSLVVGRVPQEGDSIAQLDDVFTAGDAKYEARETLQRLGSFTYPVLAIAVDRQEVGIDGKSAIEEYERKTETRVVSVITALDVYQFLRDKISEDIGFIETPFGRINESHLRRIEMYLRVYGTSAARTFFPPLEQRVIERDRSIIPACDFSDLLLFEHIIQASKDNEAVGAYKIGFELALSHGLPRVVETARNLDNTKPLIYDHQKAGTDIPDTGKNFASTCKKAGIDAVIFFPQAGPETERAWIYHALDHGLKVIVGGRMTHAAYAETEGGFISDEGALEMYRIAARAGVHNFVVPGNKPEVIQQVREIVEADVRNPAFYAPGFVAQGGKIEDATKVAGGRWHAIVGRGIFGKSDIKGAIDEYTSQLG